MRIRKVLAVAALAAPAAACTVQPAVPIAAVRVPPPILVAPAPAPAPVAVVPGPVFVAPVHKHHPGNGRGRGHW